MLREIWKSLNDTDILKKVDDGFIDIDGNFMDNLLWSNSF